MDEKKSRSWQGSNLRGQSPLDFKSNALTTRPQLLRYIWKFRNLVKLKNCGDAGDRTPGLSHAKRTLYHWATSPSSDSGIILTLGFQNVEGQEFKTFAPGEARTHGLQIMRLTRCLLRYGGLLRAMGKNYGVDTDLCKKKRTKDMYPRGDSNPQSSV